MDNSGENPNQPPAISILDGLFLKRRKEKIETIVTIDNEMKILTSNHVLRIWTREVFILLDIYIGSLNPYC